MSDLDITFAVVCGCLVVLLAYATWWAVEYGRHTRLQRKLLDEYTAEIAWWHSVYGEHTYFAWKAMEAVRAEVTATGNPYARDSRLDRVITEKPTLKWLLDHGFLLSADDARSGHDGRGRAVDWWRDRTRQFITGLRLAASRNEAVGFH